MRSEYRRNLGRYYSAAALVLMVLCCASGNIAGKYVNETHPGWEMELLKNGNLSIKSDVTDVAQYSVEGKTIIITTAFGGVRGEIEGRTITIHGTGVIGSSFDGKWVRR